MNRSIKQRTLRAVSLYDQAFPCSLVTDGEFCRSRSTFRVHPSCACGPGDGWPDVQSCNAHMVHVLRLARKLCKGHMSGNVVRVVPIGGW